MSTPAVSVVIPLYNMKHEILRALKSALSQTFQNLEIIVVDDGSTDGGPDLITEINDPRIQIVHQQRSGVSAARNAGIAKARANVVAFLDADDEWMPHFLETIMRLKETYPQCNVFATNYLYCFNNKRYISTTIEGLPNPQWEGLLENYFDIAVKSSPPLWTSAVTVSKDAITAVGGFPSFATTGEDLLTWARLAVQFKVAYSMQPQAVFHKGHHDPIVHARFPDAEDYIGQQLRCLYQVCESGGLKQYIALWHKMRASIFLQLGKTKEAQKEIAKMQEYGKGGMRIIAYKLIAMLPGYAAKKLFRFVRIIAVRGV